MGVFFSENMHFHGLWLIKCQVAASFQALITAIIMIYIDFHTAALSLYIAPDRTISGPQEPSIFTFCICNKLLLSLLAWIVRRSELLSEQYNIGINMGCLLWPIWMKLFCQYYFLPLKLYWKKFWFCLACLHLWYEALFFSLVLAPRPWDFLSISKSGLG